MRGIAAAFALASLTGEAGATTVTNCLDHGAGSLRAAVAAANSGDTVDLTGLTVASPGCSQSRITLSTGAIVVPQNDLSIVESPAFAPVISGGRIYGYDVNDPLFLHAGTGTLTLANLVMKNGYIYDDSDSVTGGCIFSNGNLKLINDKITSCYALSTYNGSIGGAIASQGYVYLLHSIVSDNHASGYTAAVAGAIFAGNGFTAVDSTISNNGARCFGIDTGHCAKAGAISVDGKLTLNMSTVSNNYSSDIEGAIYQFAGSNETVNIQQSTISNNRAKELAVGYFYASSVTIDNSTIAFNAGSTQSYFDAFHIYRRTPALLLIQSTIISNNTVQGMEGNVSGANIYTSGSHNLVLKGTVPMPPDTLTTCPMLGSLRGNGGFTQTIAPQTHSPAIDHGQASGMSYDQRGNPYVRSSGGAVDIGAYEVDQSDIVFTANFEGC